MPIRVKAPGPSCDATFLRDRPTARTGARWQRLGLLPALILTAGCGRGAPAGLYSLSVGSDPADAAFGTPDATTSAALAVEISASASSVCPGHCVSLRAAASGGTPPYTYAWTPDASGDGGDVQVCPDATTTYGVTSMDHSGYAGELGQTNAAASADLTVTVAGDCLDAGVASACDSLAASFVAMGSGANPVGPWSYGSTPTLGGAFAPYTTFVSASDVDASYADGLAQWFNVTGTSQLGLGNLPRIAFNPSSMTLNPPAGLAGVAYTIAPGQIDLGPGPLGDYSVARWTATSAGTYSVQAGFVGLCGYGGHSQTTSDVHVRHNGVELAAGYLNLDAGGNSFSFSSTIEVAAGDTIDFAMADGGNGYLYDDTGVDAVVCKVHAGDGG